MSGAIKRAIELGESIERFPLGDCSPSDDPDKQTAYIYAFLDLARPFASAIKRIGDPELSDQLREIEVDIEFLTDAYSLKAQLQGVIDCLREKTSDTAYLDRINSNISFIDTDVLDGLRKAESRRFDLRKLIRFCDELNDAYGRGNYLSCALLIRAIMNHVPPIFGQSTFTQVVSNSGRSMKAVLGRLEDGLRDVADLHTHLTIRKHEALPTRHQIEPYKPSFELLLQEIISVVSEE